MNHTKYHSDILTAISYLKLTIPKLEMFRPSPHPTYHPHTAQIR